MTTVLVVAKGQRCEALAEALEARGDEVLACPGPDAAERSCLGVRGFACPLAAAADVVVLDGSVPAAIRLAAYYSRSELPVVALSDGWHAAAAPLAARGIRVLPCDASTDCILRSIHRARRAALRRSGGSDPR